MGTETTRLDLVQVAGPDAPRIDRRRIVAQPYHYSVKVPVERQVDLARFPAAIGMKNDVLTCLCDRQDDVVGRFRPEAAAPCRGRDARTNQLHAVGARIKGKGEQELGFLLRACAPSQTGWRTTGKRI